MGDEGRGGQGWYGEIARFSREVVGRPLRWYQAEVAEAIERSVVEGLGLTITVQMARQAGKTELSAQIEAWVLDRIRRLTYVRPGESQTRFTSWDTYDRNDNVTQQELDG